ncbi:MAG: iron ABC transporter permease [Candidatus Kaelpia aquatica]|nr:iron ABC transporter permease [Candidatus Kaelpia aquatica]
MKIKILIIVILLSIITIFSLKLGEVEVSWQEIFKVITADYDSGIESSIVRDIRLPRILIALIVGAGLAVSGGVFQSVLRNPLAEPYTLGISGGACFGVALASLFLGSKFSFLIPPAGWLGALAAVFIVYFLSLRRNFTTISLILSGIVINFLFSSLVLVLFAFIKPNRVQSMILWLMGDLSSSNFNLVKIGYFVILPAIVIIVLLSRKLDILSLGDEKAHSLGLNVKKQKQCFYILASLITGTAIVLSGVVGFIGLLIPHLMRRFFGTLNRGVLIASALSGAAFLLLADTFARVIISPLELPVGVVTGLVGGVFFLVILILGKEFKVG